MKCLIQHFLIELKYTKDLHQLEVQNNFSLYYKDMELLVKHVSIWRLQLH